MKIRKETLIIFLAILLLPLASTGGFAQINMGGYTLSGDVELGGRAFIDRPSRQDRGYFELYRPYPEGFLMEQLNLLLMNKDESEYYKFFMTRPGERDQDFIFRAGKLGLYQIEVEYGQLQHLYSTVSPTQDEIRTLWETFRVSADYTPKPEIDISADYTFNHQFGDIPRGAGGFPPDAFSYTSFLQPVDYRTHTASAAAEYAEQRYQFRLAYNLSLFENGVDTIFVPNTFVGLGSISLPPNNMAQYVTGTGGVNLDYRTRINASFSYGWLSQNDDVFFDSPGTPSPASGLSATTFLFNLSGVSHPCDPLTLRMAYRAYDFNDENLNSDILQKAFTGNFLQEQDPLHEMHYSYLKQTFSTGADWKFNSWAAVDFDYRFDKSTRDFSNGDTTEHTPKVGLKIYPYDWLNLLASYAHASRDGEDFLVMNGSTFLSTPAEVLKNKFYASGRERDVVNFIAEVFPINNFIFSANFGLYDDSYNNSPFGLQKDRGWSAGADVTWTPFKCLSTTFGYLHEQMATRERTDPIASSANTLPTPVDIDLGPSLITADTFDTFTINANYAVVPDKVDLASRASYSYSTSDFHSAYIPNMNESIFHFDTYLRYRYTKCIAFKVGYIFEKFNITNQFETLFPSTTLPVQNDLDGYYKDYTAHMIVGLMQYKF